MFIKYCNESVASDVAANTQTQEFQVCSAVGQQEIDGK